MRTTAIIATALASLPSGHDRAVIAVAKPRGYRSPPPHRHSSGTPVKSWRHSGPVQSDGGKAAARRRRQIERGQLKAENGLARAT